MNLEYVLPKHIENAIYNYIPTMEGWATPERCCEMANRILQTNARVCVDIGVFAGRSTIAMGFAARELGESRVYGLDPWKIETAIEGDNVEENARWWKESSNLEKMHREAMHAIWAHRLDEWVTIIRNGSQYVHQLFPVIDFINIDGCHTELASCRDVDLFLPRLRSGGYLTFDDADWESTQKALRLIEEQCDLIKVMKDKNEARTYRKR
jgi:predicted O-methyltransferase YrrM